MPARFSTADRPSIRASLERGVDVLIVGGGINGAGLARDLALRGARVGLIEKDDFAGGTSSKSSRLIHGGLRYLEHGQVGLVFESVTERWRLSRLARHLVRPLQFMVPVREGGRVPLWKLDLGVTIYDALALFRNYRNHRRVDRAEIARALPGLDVSRIKGGVAYYDYRTDDARLTLENVIAAWEAGAFPLSKARAVDPRFDRDGRINAVVAVDEVTGDRFEIPARVVVSATGPWTDAVMRSLGRRFPGERPLMRPTKGVHIVLPATKLPLHSAAGVTHPRDGRVLFLLPFGSRSVIGTTDTDWTGSADDVRVEREDVDYLLEVARTLFPSLQVGHEDVIASWAGLRPLLNEEGGHASSVSREERTEILPDGLIAIFGGKLTTYRRMMEELAALVARQLLARGGPRLRPGSTRRIPLPGAIGLDTDAELDAVVDHLSHRAGLPLAVATHLAERYGARAPELLDLAAADPSARLLDRISPDLPHLKVEIAWAAEHEMALDLEDVMVRRTQLFYDALDQAVAFAPEAARILARRLDWSPSRTEEEVAKYQAVVENGRRWRTEPATPAREKASA